MPKRKKGHNGSAVKNVTIKYAFNDGSEHSISIAEQQNQLIRHYSAAAVSDDPIIREMGLRNLKEISKLAAETIAQKFISATSGKRGGTASKRKNWAIEVSKRLIKQTPKNQILAWEMIPTSPDHFDIELLEDDFEVYRDGDTLVAVNINTHTESKLKKSTFLKEYYGIEKKLGR
jgi:hypothetical protein